MLFAAAALAAVGPAEKTLGEHVRIVYLHGAWVLTAELYFGLAALMGLAALFGRRPSLHRWSQALGQTGLIFWVTYLPLSLLAMQANWNGLFLAEPRFRLGLSFAIFGLLLQIGLAFLERPAATSLANVLFFVTLWLAQRRTAYVLHPPPSPIFSSGNLLLQLYFLTLLFLTALAAWFLTRWLLARGVQGGESEGF
uniref:Uncharacterized protein n=1 Tax=uncultured Chloroflexota bacterium TaxID=166587 RepID=H5SQ44_9CHLR|nr:hypothetical protein HGMM_F55G01C08 [uncultured Chloroflexota bacterium]